jgi:hypothetical protein
LAILTSVTAVEGLPECALSITRVLPSLECLHHWNNAARLFQHHMLSVTFQVFHYRSSQV